MRRLWLLCLAGLGVLGACSNPEIDSSDYARACSADDECVLVFEGDVCVCDVERTPAAIRASALPAWIADFDALAADCGGPSTACPPSPALGVRCASSICAVNR